MSSCPNPAANLEALLRDACQRALALGLSFTNQLRLYRSIIALAREVRLRFGGAMPASSSRTLSALLAAVCERASELGPDPELPLPDAILVQRLAVQLSRAARQAGIAEPAERQYVARHAMHREVPPEQTLPAQNPMHREEPTQPEAPEIAEPSEQTFPAQNPKQREVEADDDRLSAWRRDHKTDRDQRAHEKLRTVIDERVIAKVKAMNQRDHEARAAAA